MAARTVEERIAIIDEKISKKKAEIKALETQKAKAPPSCYYENCDGESKSLWPLSRGNRRKTRP